MHERWAREIPDGGFVLLDGAPWLVLGDALMRWTPGGYVEPRRRPRGGVDVLTPPTSLDILAAGWNGTLPLFHPSAGRS
jgi:hypothetical protein